MIPIGTVDGRRVLRILSASGTTAHPEPISGVSVYRPMSGLLPRVWQVPELAGHLAASPVTGRVRSAPAGGCRTPRTSLCQARSRRWRLSGERADMGHRRPRAYAGRLVHPL